MWKHKFKEVRKIDSDEINQAIEDYINLKSAITSTKTQIANLAEKIEQYMTQEGVDRVFSNDGIIAQTLRKTYKYDEKQLKEILEPLDKWEDVLKVDGIALKNIMSVLSPSARKDIEHARILDKETKSLTVKKK
jgi:hypothetical protein